MASKGEKLRQLRIRQRSNAGRPKKEGVERYPSGGIKRTETEKEVISVAVEGLKRVHNLDYRRDGLASYTLGRIFLDDKISKAELDAGNWYIGKVIKYYGLVGIPFPTPRAQNLFAVRGHDGDISETRADRARSATNAAMRLNTVLGCCEQGPQVKSTVFNVCIEDNEMLRMMPDHQMQLLRRGLRALLFEQGLQTNHKSVS